MKPWKQAGLNTIGYILAFAVVRYFFKRSMDWGTFLILTIVYFILNYVLLSVLYYVNNKNKK